MIPVPPAMSAMCLCLLGSHEYFGIGPLNSRRWSGFISCMCVDMGPLGYFLTKRSR